MNKRLLLTLWLLLLQFALALAQRASSPRKTIYLAEGIPMAFTLIKAGHFDMGSPEDEQGRDRDEQLQKKVRVSNDFYIGTYEVTQAQWKAIMGYNPATFQQTTEHLQHPVESVSWMECLSFIQKLNSLGKGIFRFPTELEWEYACRAGTTTRFYWGDDPDEWKGHQYGWINSRSMATPHPVGQKKPNPWGLYDMSGNVWEWCSDNYGPYDQPKSASDTLKVFRGGSWYDFHKSQRSANRHKHGIHKGYPVIGLRLVLENEN